MVIERIDPGWYLVVLFGRDRANYAPEWGNFEVRAYHLDRFGLCETHVAEEEILIRELFCEVHRRMKSAEKHCCGTCDLYSAKQIYPGVFGRCEWADRPPFCVGNMDVDFPEEEDGLTPEDGQDCKAWRAKG